MRVALVTCFNAEWHLRRMPTPYIPLNLLCAAASLRARGHEVQIVDQAVALATGKAPDGPNFHRRVAEIIGEGSPDVVGFTTMCNSYPQTLTLARHCREALGDVKLILGGPQATAVDQATLRHFPWVDAIVRGEADHTLPALVDYWESGGETYDGLAGLTWRDQAGAIHRTESQPLLNLDALPYPAYDLYPGDLAKFKMMPVEAGRGCPFACTFCSTNLFFGRRYRTKSPARLVAEMEYVRDTVGSTRFDLVHDMLTVDKAWVRAFSRLLIAGNYGFRWGCSARVDCVTPDLLEEMAAAGCDGIFFGIETGSERLQPVVKKKLHTATVLPVLKQCAALGMDPTASFITGFPEETADDAISSFEMALDVLQISPHTTVQLHLLAPLVGSPLHEQYRDRLKFDGHSSDISLFLLTPAEFETVQRFPEVFSSFYFIPAPYLDRRLIKALSASLYGSAPLLLAMVKSGVNLRNVFRRWLSWQSDNVGAEAAEQDYYLARFPSDFVRFLAEELVPETNSGALADLVEYHATRLAVEKGEVADRLVFRQFGFDLDEMAGRLRTEEKLWDSLEPRTWGMLFVNLGGNPESGFAYLEVPILSGSIRPGDELEMPDLREQILTGPSLTIRNKTQGRVLVFEHHLSREAIRALEVEGAADSHYDEPAVAGVGPFA